METESFIVHKEWTNSVIECNPINERILKIRIAAKPRNISDVQIYAPTNSSSEEDIGEFYDALDDVLENTEKRDYIIVQGDWNCQIGSDTYEDWKGTVGKFGLRRTNERGERALEFAERYKLVIANTLFPHKKSRLVTWHAPNGRDHLQLDYIMVTSKLRTSLLQRVTRVYPGADIGSDHELLMAGVSLKLRKTKNKEVIRLHYDVDKLQDPAIAEQFRATVGGKFGPLMLIENIQEQVAEFTKQMNETASEVLGKRKKPQKP
ncbi:craniofacial development protein 2-like [Penaeus indicus]|uniref:craniofacial development protein 2-like n=1 Tax=Penaeus indicus TaxID=29960 RepID=UPI00300D8F5D